MRQIVAALKAIYVALGGSADDVANMTLTADVLNAIATQAAIATAPELPTVSSTNNGKVLKVVDGKWAIGTDNTGT